MRLGNTVGTRIHEFDELGTQTVGTFNALFPECPIKDYEDYLEVEIGPPAKNNSRVISVTTGFGLCVESFNHKMHSDILYSVNREDCSLNEMEKELTEINGVML